MPNFIMENLCSSSKKKITYISVANEVARTGIPTTVGCGDADHKVLLTKWIVSFYLNTRMIFACKEKTKEVEEMRTASRQLKKQSKLDMQKQKNASK